MVSNMLRNVWIVLYPRTPFFFLGVSWYKKVISQDITQFLWTVFPLPLLWKVKSPFFCAVLPIKAPRSIVCFWIFLKFCPFSVPFWLFYSISCIVWVAVVQHSCPQSVVTMTQYQSAWSIFTQSAFRCAPCCICNLNITQEKLNCL